MTYQRKSGAEQRAERRARGQYVFVSKPIVAGPSGLPASGASSGQYIAGRPKRGTPEELAMRLRSRRRGG